MDDEKFTWTEDDAQRLSDFQKLLFRMIFYTYEGVGIRSGLTEKDVAQPPRELVVQTYEEITARVLGNRAYVGALDFIQMLEAVAKWCVEQLADSGE